MDEPKKPNPNAETPSGPAPAAGSTVQPQGAGTSTGGSEANAKGNTNTSAQSAPARKSRKSSKKKWAAAVLVLALLLILGFGAYAAYAHYYMPQRAPVAYMERLMEVDSADFEIVTLEHEGAGEEVELAATGSFINTDNEFAFDVSSNVDQGDGLDGLTFDPSFDLRYVDDVVYLRSDLLEIFDLMMLTEEEATDTDMWYSLDLQTDEYSEMVGMFDFRAISSNCSSEDVDALQDYLQNDAGDRLEITDAKRHDWFGVEHNGERVAHYSGVIKEEAFRTIEEDMARVTSEDCLSEDEFDIAEDVQDMALVYDLYQGRNQDELQITIQENGEDTTAFSLKTGNYNGADDIHAPEESEPFENLFGDSTPFGGPMPEPQPLPEPGDDIEGFDPEDFDDFDPEDFEDFDNMPEQPPAR